MLYSSEVFDLILAAIDVKRRHTFYFDFRHNMHICIIAWNAGLKVTEDRRDTSLSRLKRGPIADKIYCTAHFAREVFRETRLPGEPQLSHTEISRNRAKTSDGVEEEEEKFHHTGVFRGSWRKKMGKVFICGLPLRSGPTAALNRSQLRGVGSYLSSRGVGRKSASSRTTCWPDVVLYSRNYSKFILTIFQTSRSTNISSPLTNSRVNFSICLRSISVFKFNQTSPLLKLVLFVILIS